MSEKSTHSVTRQSPSGAPTSWEKTRRGLQTAQARLRKDRRRSRAGVRGLRPGRHGIEKLRDTPHSKPGGATNVLAGFTCPPMLRDVLAELTSQRLLGEERKHQFDATEGLAVLEEGTEEPRVARSGTKTLRTSRTTPTETANPNQLTTAETEADDPTRAQREGRERELPEVTVPNHTDETEIAPAPTEPLAAAQASGKGTSRPRKRRGGAEPAHGRKGHPAQGASHANSANGMKTAPVTRNSPLPRNIITVLRDLPQPVQRQKESQPKRDTGRTDGGRDPGWRRH